ncbi:MAG: CoA-acylating methylmalonate-semialdehyde dehydrogenase [Polyangiaceae bacterium]|nr:CoA-acylating methylmalonate-semialdehyde dehydrogenase [Polyangiaceae bacterium]NUQ71963.1 CoA-acylating methylmalonate-semialdehyde dehydrogenase [Polyangiaceae bacterium]
MQSGSNETIRNYINGAFTPASASQELEVRNPATQELLGRVPLSTASEVEKAASAARAAFPAWRETPAPVRARYLFKLKNLLEDNFERIAEMVTKEHGKTLDESRGDVRRGIDNVETACGIPSLMLGQCIEDVAKGIDSTSMREPVGVFAAIAPFNFPAMVPLWFLPYAIATGNTFIVKPSEVVPLTQDIIAHLIAEIGLPPGVVNYVHGGRDAVNAILTNPEIDGVSFVGSTPVAEHVYKTGSAHGKRVQALGGAKNFLTVMPDADFDKTVSNIADSCYGCAGERCLAGSVILCVGDAYGKFKDRFLEAARGIKVGYGMDPSVMMGPVISRAHREKVLGYIQKGVDEGAELLLDGRGVKVDGYPDGNWVGPTVFNRVRPSMTIAREEIFGPVVCLIDVPTMEDALKIIDAHELANTSSIYTSSGRAAREYSHRVKASMLGVNIGVAAPMSFFSFGGAKKSFFGDLKAHGRESILFYTDGKVTISRWW